MKIVEHFRCSHTNILFFQIKRFSSKLFVSETDVVCMCPSCATKKSVFQIEFIAVYNIIFCITYCRTSCIFPFCFSFIFLYLHFYFFSLTMISPLCVSGCCAAGTGASAGDGKDAAGSRAQSHAPCQCSERCVGGAAMFYSLLLI